ncbi:MAG: hypothetical protein H6973_08965 [Gammaproteobacteria bacterium]|nr:hypothetical protein [Gammaproteobacteria bacterium]
MGAWSSLAIDIEASHFYITTADQSIYTFDLATRSFLKQQKLSPPVPNLAEIITVGSGVVMGFRPENRTIYKIDPSTGINSPFTIASSSTFVPWTFTADIANGKFYIIGVNGSKVLHSFDSSTGAETVKQLDLDYVSINGVVLGREGKLLARVSDGNSGNFYVINPLSGASTILETTIRLSGFYANTLTSDPENNRFYILGGGTLIYAFDLSTGEIQKNPPPKLTGIAIPQALRAVPLLP